MTWTKAIAQFVFGSGLIGCALASTTIITPDTSGVFFVFIATGMFWGGCAMLLWLLASILIWISSL